MFLIPIMLRILSNFKTEIFCFLLMGCIISITHCFIQAHQINYLRTQNNELMIKLKVQEAHVDIQNEAIKQWKLYSDALVVKKEQIKKLLKESDIKYYKDEKDLYAQKYSADCSKAIYQSLVSGEKMGKEWNQGD